MPNPLPKKLCLFGFEIEEFGDLRLIPLLLRYRLDGCGIKLSLAAWQQLPLAVREELLTMPCETELERSAWIVFLQTQTIQSGGDPPSKIEVWTLPLFAPESVQQRIQASGKTLDPVVWNGLSPLQRYVLCKLAQSKMGDRLFPLAWREFSLFPVL